MKVRISGFSVLLSLALGAADTPKAPPLLPPDQRYKADVLLVVAHPDDDVLAGAYLARIILDEHKRVAVIYCTSGDGGGNAVGYEAGAALGQMRIIEARKALNSLGIENVWFLGGHDNPGQDVLWSLDSWNHGRALNEMVRLVRLTRPDVIMTWLPDYVVGENHDDHQASGVLATEAFDLAGDPTAFPEQISAPRNRVGMSNMTEGLHPWQPQKIYYFTDAFEDFSAYWHDPEDLSPWRKNLTENTGPTYQTTDISPSRHKSYAKLNAEQQVFYLTQEAYLGQEALESNNFKGFEYPLHLIFGKSVVGGSVTGDIFEKTTNAPLPFVRVKGYVPGAPNGLSLELGGPWAFYREFWKAHDLEHLAKLIPVPEIAVDFGQSLNIPLILRNRTATAEEIKLTVVLPAGLVDRTRYALYPVGPGEDYPVLAVVAAPAAGKPTWQEVVWKAEAGGRPVGTITMRVYVGKSGGLPQ